MGKRNRYQDCEDPEYRRWGRTYHTFPGVNECVRLILQRKAKGAWADIIAFELAENARAHLNDLIDAFRVHEHKSEHVALFILMALEMAALPESADFLSEVLNRGTITFVPYARRALIAIDTKTSRTVRFNAKDTELSG